MTTNELHNLAKTVAPLIGYTWYPSDNHQDGAPRSSARIRSENGALFLSEITYGSRKGMIHVAVSWPSASERNWQTYSLSEYERKDRTSEIHVSGKKTPTQIARDIKSRLLPDAESLYQEARAKMQRDIDYNDTRRASIAKLAALTGNAAPARYEENRDASFYIKGVGDGYSASAKVAYGNEVEFQFRTSLDDAQKVIDFIRSLKKTA